MRLSIHRQNKIAVINSEGAGRAFFTKPFHNGEQTGCLNPGDTVLCLTGVRDGTLLWMLVASARGVGWIASHHGCLGWDYVE